MNELDIVPTVCTIDWRAVAQFVTALVLAFGIYFAWKQLCISKLARDAEARISIAQRTIQHNDLIMNNLKARDAIAALEGLSIMENDEQKELYWAYRLVHLSHVNLIWQVWELGGRPLKGKNLNLHFDGWQRFAKEIVAKKLQAAFFCTELEAEKPENRAGADIWSGMDTYEVIPEQFVVWFKELANQTS